MTGLAHDGVILERHYSQHTCTPARAALLTGRYPLRSGMASMLLTPGSPVGLRSDETLAPQFLKTLGYKTAHVGASSRARAGGGASWRRVAGEEAPPSSRRSRRSRRARISSLTVTPWTRDGRD